MRLLLNLLPSFSGGATNYEAYYELAGLAEPTRSALAEEWGFKPGNESFVVLDRLGIPRRRWRDVRTSNEWEAFYAAVWASTMKAVADQTRTSVSRVARALGDRSPFSARHVW